MNFKLLSLDKFRGCMVGGAVGDALGYPVEFMSYKQIQNVFGPEGITAYKLHNGVAQISDDTQMTMYTANGLLFAYTRMKMKGIGAPLCTYAIPAYTEWYYTQFCPNAAKLKEKLDRDSLSCWITNVPEMYASRVPGNTCLNAIAGGCKGTVNHKINNSKGCGGVMRVAPVGLFGTVANWSAEEVMYQGADFAALTHTHELGYIPAAALAYIINQITANKDMDLVTIIVATIRELNNNYGDKKHVGEMTGILERALDFAQRDLSDIDCIRVLGEGWVGEEALAVAVYCALRHSDSFEDAIIAAVNHGGDSDSTGAICGNIMGAHLGFNAIPDKYIGKLELLEQLLELADDLAILPDVYIDEFGGDDLWNDKYIRNIYPRRWIE